MSDKIEEIRERHELVGGSGSVIHPTGFSWTIPGWVAHADRAFLLAEVDRQRAEIERLTRERNEARAEYARLCDDIERIENDAWHDGAKHGTSH